MNANLLDKKQTIIKINHTRLRSHEYLQSQTELYIHIYAVYIKSQFVICSIGSLCALLFQPFLAW